MAKHKIKNGLLEQEIETVTVKSYSYSERKEPERAPHEMDPTSRFSAARVFDTRRQRVTIDDFRR